MEMFVCVATMHVRYNNNNNNDHIDDDANDNTQSFCVRRRPHQGPKQISYVRYELFSIRVYERASTKSYTLFEYHLRII